MTLAMAAVWAGAIAAIVVLFRAGTQRGDSADRSTQQRGPAQLLAERFARGEIDESEYRFRLGVLQDNATPTSRSGAGSQ